MGGWSNWSRGSNTPRVNLSPAEDFAKAGQAAYSPLSGEVAPELLSCSDSSQCASGWTCSGGTCVDSNGTPAGGSSSTTTTSPGFQSAYPDYQPPNGQSSGGSVVPNSGGNSNVPIGAVYPRSTGSGGGSGSTSGCGDNYYNDPDGNRVSTPCEPNPADNGCRKSGCGPDRFNASDCCGEKRCCRYSANGSGVTVNCNCGPCPDPSNECNSFCSNFRAANGQLYPGCNDQSICDECSDCISTPGGPPGTSCQAKVIGTAPCQCEESSCGAACDRCDPDGICRVDCDNCVVPFPTYARCSCGDFRTTSYVNACGARWADPVDCSALCEERDEPDKCAGTCTSVSWCDGQPTPPCPTGSSCTSTGTISAGGKTCYIRTDCDKTNVPPECEECDCNCENDCPDCQICNPSGKCVPDPDCEDQYFIEYAWYTLDYEVQWSESNECEGGKTTYDIAHLIGGANSGILLKDPMGTAWVVTSNNDCPTCENCPTSGLATGRNSSGYVQYPDGTQTSSRNLGFCQCTSGSETPRNLYYRTGITVGIGDSPEAARCAAKAKNPKLNISPSCS